MNKEIYKSEFIELIQALKTDEQKAQASNILIKYNKDLLISDYMAMLEELEKVANNGK